MKWKRNTRDRVSKQPKLCIAKYGGHFFKAYALMSPELMTIWTCNVCLWPKYKVIYIWKDSFDVLVLFSNKIQNYWTKIIRHTFDSFNKTFFGWEIYWKCHQIMHGMACKQAMCLFQQCNHKYDDASFYCCDIFFVFLSLWFIVCTKIVYIIHKRIP